MTRHLLGDAGVTMFGAIVAVACLTTAVGLVSSTASYFHRLSQGKLSYEAAVAIECAIGIIICNLGLDSIIALADPVLAVVCPAFMTTIVLLLFRRRISSSWVYRGAALGATISAIAIALNAYGGLFPPLAHLPLYNVDFAWLPFALIGGIIGAIAAALQRKKRSARKGASRREGPEVASGVEDAVG